MIRLRVRGRTELDRLQAVQEALIILAHILLQSTSLESVEDRASCAAGKRFVGTLTMDFISPAALLDDGPFVLGFLPSR
jgi:hypothetical protein